MLRSQIKKASARGFLPILILIGFSYFVSIQSISHPLSQNYLYSDSSIYQYIGKIMLGGGMPYRDAFDHKGPLLYVINALAYAINSNWGIWLVDFLCLSTIAIQSYIIAKLWLNELLAVFLSCLTLSFFQNALWIGNMPDFYAVPFVMAAVILFIKYCRTRCFTSFDIIKMGVYFCLVLLLKINLVILFPIMLLYIFIDGLLKKEYGFLCKLVVVFGATTVAILAAVIAWLMANNTLSAFWDQYIVFNFQYQGARQESSVKLIQTISFFTLDQKIFTLLFVGFILLGMCTLEEAWVKKLLSFVLIGFVLVLVVVSMPSRSFRQYMFSFYPLYILGLSICLKYINDMLKEKNRQLLMMGLVSALTIAFLLPNCVQIISDTSSWWDVRSDRVEVVNCIVDNTDETDTVAVISASDCWAYLKSNRESATTFPYLQGDILRDRIRPDLKEDYLSQLKSNVPRAYVVNKGDGFMKGSIDLSAYTLSVDNENYEVYIR